MNDSLLALIAILMIMVPSLVRLKYARIIVPILATTGATVFLQTAAFLDFFILAVLPLTLSVGLALIIPRHPLLAYICAIFAVAMIGSQIPSDAGKSLGALITFTFTFVVSIFTCGLASWLWRALVVKPRGA